ncbi:hypothetical protein LSH36_200g02297 [Paralvinella palmiformis]|uniref:CUB domain-containing protein n=1 Tax=Paralvinella palmiformis TaxID=53620 RepID=A0AAD9N7J9_9ANNE|nr:hypothetical protein LSH36_200g02297 [Paralvinella palmiformis]
MDTVHALTRFVSCVSLLCYHNKCVRFLIIVILLSPGVVYSVTVDVCNGYAFRATCGVDELIVMEEAELGRMEPGKCLPDEMGNFGCRNDILFLTDRWCSGRKQCEFTSPNQDIMEANTECRQGLAVYLRAKYTCVLVNGHQCSTTSPNVLEMSSGILSSHITDKIGCGSTRSPWIIKAKHGQTVELSLLDFKALDRARSHSLVTCSDIYGFVVEKTLNINQTICGQNTRESVIYRSKTNSVEIYIRKDSGSKFLIKYTGNGCSDPKPPPQAWYKRNGNEAVIGCEASDKEWRLTDRKEKKYNESLNQENMTISEPPNSLAHSKHISSKMVEGQDDYLEPNTNTGSEKLQPNVDEPLIHIWETPLPDPTNPNRMPTSRECTIHRKPKEGQTLRGSNPTALRKDHIRTGTSYYSPNTGHKYYVVDREITVDVCSGYAFRATCGASELIVMEAAELGRMEPGKCLPDEIGNFGFNGEQCSTSSSNILDMSSGILSSHITDEIGCGSTRSPWIIKAKHGQTVELSLLDFKALDRARSHSLVTCSDIYGFVVEKTLNINQTICGQNTRESVIYRSKTNSVEIYIRKDSGSNFLIKYTANGCSDPKPPPQAWYKRNGNEAVIGCETSDKEWRLTCSEKLQPSVDEPLIHIWETPLPDPTNPNRMPASRECTIHRKPKEGQTLPGSNPTALRKDHIRTGTSYYSPNTGHKYYVVDREITVDVCIGYAFRATCGASELIVMEAAELGRMEPGKCLPDEIGNFGFNGEQCSTSSPNIFEMSSGILSSHITDEIGCGSVRSPWIIKAKHGQTVEISLLDFKALDRARSHSLVTCSDIYGFVMEKTLNINQTICGQNTRESVIYRSKTNSVEIYIRKDSGSNFLIKYTANGCSDPKPPPQAWYKRNGNEAVIGCETSDKEWRLTNRKEKKYNKSINPDNLATTHQLGSLTPCKHISPKVVEGQDDYLEPNSEKLQPSVDEPLIHIWETPLPDPTNPNRMPTSRECTVHRKPKEGQTLRGTNPTALRKDHIRTGTSYYSPNTGHKYYVVDRET